MTKIVLLMFISLVLIMVLGCSSAPAPTSNAWQEGYNQGYKDGLHYADTLRAGGSGTWTTAPVTSPALVAPINNPVISSPVVATVVSQTVYITKSGTKYHREGCSTLSRSTPISTTKEEAIKKGYEPCSVCKP